MQRIVKQFENVDVKIVKKDNQYFVSTYDVSEALKFENPRRTVMNMAINSSHKVELIEWEPNFKEHVADIRFIIELSLLAEKAITQRFLFWMVDTIKENEKGSQRAPVDPSNGLNYQTETTTYAVTQIAKKYGLTGKMLNDILHESKIQYKVNDQWILYLNYQDLGYTTTRSVPKRGSENYVLHTYWTTKGMHFIESLLRQKGIREVPYLDQGQMNLFEGENK